MELINISIIMLMIALPSKPSEAALIMFNEDPGTGEVSSISNCTCVLGSPTCTSTALLASSFCTCTPSTPNDVGDVATNATNGRDVSWWNTEALTICCQSLTTATAKTLLDSLVEFSHTSKLTLDHCEGVMPTTDEFFVVYGLQEVTIQTETAANNPRQYVSMTESDQASSNKRSREYRDYHIAFIGKRALDGDAELKSYSVWSTPEEATGDVLQAAIDRAPESIKSKPDGTIMFTPIYV